MKHLLPSLTALLAMSPALVAVADVHNDFDGDGRADLLWRNTDTGANVIWRSGVYTNSISVTRVTNPDWKIACSDYFDGDRRADIVWRNTITGANVAWLSANSANASRLTAVTNQAWKIVP